jgi:hypothetical protein
MQAPVSEFLSNPTAELEAQVIKFITEEPKQFVPMIPQWISQIQRREIVLLLESLWTACSVLSYDVVRPVGCTMLEIAALMLESTSIETQKQGILLLSNSYYPLFQVFIKERDQKYWNLMNLMKQAIDSWFDHPNEGIRRSVILFLQQLIITQSVSNQKVFVPH